MLCGNAYTGCDFPATMPQAPFCGIVIGNEENGISAEVIEQCDHRVYIPMTGKAESLNAAIAASLCMWELSENITTDRERCENEWR